MGYTKASPLWTGPQRCAELSMPVEGLFDTCFRVDTPLPAQCVARRVYMLESGTK